MTTMPALAERAHYYSTACLHMKHIDCRGTCKFCSRPCGCDCHNYQSAPAAAGDQPTEEHTMSSTHDPNTEPDPPTRAEADADERDDQRDETQYDPDDVHPDAGAGRPY
jgi:hypothetical protein